MFIINKTLNLQAFGSCALNIDILILIKTY